MGVPAFYRWLVESHPRSVADVVEDSPAVVNGVEIPVDSSLPNPNGIEFDNLYLDMNGIIHPCFHPEGLSWAPTSYDEVFVAIFKYIDKIFSIIRPRKLLYLAIDGVAPRAKMNHQRARRFRAAKEAADEAPGEESAKRYGEGKVGDLTGLGQCNKLDSNVITPGTEFMSLLSSALKYYVHLKMNGDLGWKDIKVIVSDASVPGEGEHKIMSYIRLQRNLPGFDPNTRHCLYGLDADLIMLALASHEIHFSILREVSKPPEGRNRKDASKFQRKRGRIYPNLVRSTVLGIEEHILKQKFQFFHVWVLRDYLDYELRIPDPTVEIDLERLIDDFVFMCMFVGNDFLPHMPSLQISEGALDLLMKVYKAEFVQMGGYLTDSWKVNLERVQHFLQAVGSYENLIFKKRSRVEKQLDMRFRGSSSHSRPMKTKGSVNCATGNVEPVIDQIKLEEVGWKERYYAQKFEAKTADELERIRKHTVLKYVEGICWNMHYYYEGVCSWQWFYPYHYAPFASDFHGLDKLHVDFTLGMPFKPFDQLMGLLPAARKLMTDPSSPILDFYPSDFELDLSGKRFSWQAICKLPFIEESRLLPELAKVEHTLTDEEKQRNCSSLDVLFVHKSHPLARKIFSFYMKSRGHPKLHEAKVKQKINPKVSGGMNGYMYVSENLACPPMIDSPVHDMPMIPENDVISVFYKFPSFHSHIPRPPEGVIMPSKSVSKKDVFYPPVLWHEKSSIPGRLNLDRRTAKFISSRRLAVSAHRLVSMLQAQGSNRLANFTGIDDVEPKSDQKSRASNNEMNAGEKESNNAALPKKKEPASSTKGNRDEKESGSVGSKKRKHMVVNKDEKESGPDEVATVLNRKASASGKEVKGEGKESGLDDVAPVRNQKTLASGEEVKGDGRGSVVRPRKRKRRAGRSENSLTSCTSAADVPLISNPKQTTSVKDLKMEEEASGAVALKDRRCKRGNKACGNGTGDADVASLPNHKPSNSQKEDSEEGNEPGAIGSRKSATLVPNQTAPNFDKNINGERPSLTLLQVLMTGHSCLPNQRPTVPQKELDRGAKT